MSGSPFSHLIGLAGGLACPKRIDHRLFEAVAHADLTAAGALVFVPGHDMALLGNSAYRVEARDANGRAALGFAGPAGTGADPGLDAAVTVTGITKASPGVVTFAAGHGLAAGNLVWFDGLTEMTELNGTYVCLGTQAGDTFEILNTSAYGAAETTGGDVAQRVINPGAKGLTVYQAKDLTARGWAWIDPAFDRHNVAEIIVDRTEDLRLLYVTLDRGGPAPDIGAGSVSFSPGEIVKETITPVGLTAREMFKHTSASAGFPAYSLTGNFNQAAGQALLFVVPGFDGEPGANGGFLSTWDGYGSVAYTNGAKIVITDGPNYTDRSLTWGLNSPFWIVAQWWDAARKPDGVTNAQGIRIGVATVSGGAWSIAWVGDVAYDGGFTAGSLLRLFYDNTKDYHWDSFLIHAEPQTEAEIVGLMAELQPI